MARQGVILLACFVYGYFLAIPILTEKSHCGLSGLAVIYYGLGLYFLYLIIKFIIWLIKTLKRK